MPTEDAWDWPLLLYVATVTLGRREGEFWRMTPRKLFTLVNMHVELNSSNDSKPKTGFVDQIGL